MRLLVDLPKDSRRDCFRRGRWRDFALKLIPPPGSRFTSLFAKLYVFTETARGSYFKNTKKTARIRQKKAAKWFHWSDWPLNITVTRTVNTVREITSWMIFSCIRLNGPPFSMYPILLAGTWAQYSRNATPHEKRMTRIRGQLVEIFIS